MYAECAERDGVSNLSGAPRLYLLYVLNRSKTASSTCIIVTFSSFPHQLCGQGLGNVFSAREFVWWYNGHPDCRDLPVDLSKVQSLLLCRQTSLRVENTPSGPCIKAAHNGSCGLQYTLNGADVSRADTLQLYLNYCTGWWQSVTGQCASCAP